MFNTMFSVSDLNAVGLTVIRIGMGLLFIGHGYPKILRGEAEWRWLGEQMNNLGITFAPVFWGLCAALAEFIGGVCLVVGFNTRIAAGFLSFVMFVAVVHHLVKGDTYGYIAFPLSQLIVFIGLIIAGGGPFSLDYYMAWATIARIFR